MNTRVPTYPYEFKRSSFPDGSIGVMTVVGPNELWIEISHAKDTTTNKFQFHLNTAHLTPDVIHALVKEAAHRWILRNQMIKDQAIQNGATLQ